MSRAGHALVVGTQYDIIRWRYQPIILLSGMDDKEDWLGIYLSRLSCRWLLEI